MADHPAPTPAPELPYLEQSSPSYAEKAAATFNFAPAQDGAVLTGPCPRCEHSMPWWIFRDGYRTIVVPHLGAPAVDTLTTASAATTAAQASDASDDGDDEPMVCQCSVIHPSTLPGKKGCGAGWNLLVPRTW